MSIVIGEDGAVRQAVVEDPGPHPGFAPAALHAVVRFRFRPAEIDGVPAAVEISYRYEFVLRKAAPPPAAEAAVALEGRVVERGTRAPVAGAAVEATAQAAGGAGGVVATAETDADGRFALRGLPPGKATVRIVSAEHEALTVEETVRAGPPRAVEYRLERRHYDPYEAVVRAERPRHEPTVRTVEQEEVRTLPGTQGDVLKVLQDLPGVARSPFGIGLLVVRGSAPADTDVYLDGVPIPLVFHFGGITSVVSSDVIEALDFYPGNFSSRWGRALGGTIDVRTREPKDAFHGAAQLDIFDGRAEAEGPIGPATGFLSLRRSWADAVLAAVLPRVAPKTASELRVAPRYYDYQAKLSAPVLGGTGSAFAFGSDDKFEYVRSNEQSGRPTFLLATSFHRGGVRWRRPMGELSNDLVLAFGKDRIDVVQSSNFGVRTDLTSLTLRDGLEWRPSDALAIEVGTDAILRTFEYSVYSPPLRAPGDVGGPLDTPEATVGEDARGTWLSPGAYLEADWRVVPAVRVVAGLRLDADTRLGAGKAWVDPRLSVHWDAAPGTRLTAAAGRYSAPPAPQETTRTFGNPDLGPQHALHLSLGLQQELLWASRLELTGYYKEMGSLVTPTRAVDASGRLLHLSNEGRGEAMGVELLLRRELARGLFGWVSYTLSRSIRQDDPTLPGYPRWHLFAFDQTHVLALVLSYRLPGDWILGTRLRAVSGNPYTPPAGHLLDADTGRFQCLPAAGVASARLPGFFQADARVDKRWVFDRWMLSVYLDVQNVTNRENAEFRFESYDCTDSVPVPSVPLFPALGLRAEW